jgi:hypothetical protein
MEYFVISLSSYSNKYICDTHFFPFIYRNLFPVNATIYFLGILNFLEKY